MDAGGLAQMTYNNFPSSGGLGAPGSGFASRGKGSQLKRLSVAPSPAIGSINENGVDDVRTPRTSRSHLLAGLRTAPKSGNVPASAPSTQTRHRTNYESSSYATNMNAQNIGYGIPPAMKTSTYPPNAYGQYGVGVAHQGYSSPAEHVLAPPPVQITGQDDEQMDPNMIAHLLATEFYLAQRQQQLQQQLLQLTAQQFQGMAIDANGNISQHSRYPSMPQTPQTAGHGQQFQNRFAQVQQEIPIQQAVQLVYNPINGQYGYAVDVNGQQTQLSTSPPPLTPSYTSSPPKHDIPTFRAEVSPPRDSSPTTNSASGDRTSPVKKTPSPPQDVLPLPPPSANAFRRGHKKASSLAFNLNAHASVSDGPKTAFTRPVGMAYTPLTGTFGPGQGRAGEHPVRQPRGPPPLEELVASPTTRHEGSKNFAARQRRRAVNSLVRAGIERRGVRSGSGGSMTPVSESEISFPVSSDNDSDSVHSAGEGILLPSKRSVTGLRGSARNAIGSEMQELTKKRSCSPNSLRIGGHPEEIKRNTPLLVLTNAEKRRSAFY